jgi:hypothetical protein
VKWYRDRATLRWIAARYLPWMLVLNLAWEAAHVRLYTLWQEAEAAYIAFSVSHCTLGDVVIGLAALMVALMLVRASSIAHWPWATVATITSLAGIAYTIFSEWMNITLLRSWTYAEGMPTLEIAGFEIGLTPLAQWLVLPPIALYLGRARLSPADRSHEEPD